LIAESSFGAVEKRSERIRSPEKFQRFLDFARNDNEPCRFYSTLTSILSLARERRTRSAGEGRKAKDTYFGEACNAVWYSGFLWYSTNRKPQLISVEGSFVSAFLAFRNFSIFVFSSRC
jgi:hypothetical protein